jgi:flagellar motor component MotA
MYKLTLTILLLFLLTEKSYAYLGPGLGLAIIAATLGVILALLAALFGLIWFPLKKFLKKRKKNKNKKI